MDTQLLAVVATIVGSIGTLVGKDIYNRMFGTERDRIREAQFLMENRVKYLEEERRRDNEETAVFRTRMGEISAKANMFDYQLKTLDDNTKNAIHQMRNELTKSTLRFESDFGEIKNDLKSLQTDIKSLLTRPYSKHP